MIRLILDELQLTVEVDYFGTRIARHVSLVTLMNSAMDHGSSRYLHKTTTQLGRRLMIFLDLDDE